MTVKTYDGGQQILGLFDCASTLDFVRVRGLRMTFFLSTRKSKVNTPARLANGQRVTSSTICETTLERARQEFQRALYVLRDLGVVHMVLGLPWLDDEQPSLQFGTMRGFALMDGASAGTHNGDRRPECRLIPSRNIQKAHAQDAPKQGT
jgi:hypothetical protein